MCTRGSTSCFWLVIFVEHVLERQLDTATHQLKATCSKATNATLPMYSLSYNIISDTSFSSSSILFRTSLWALRIFQIYQPSKIVALGNKFMPLQWGYRATSSVYSWLNYDLWCSSRYHSRSKSRTGELIHPMKHKTFAIIQLRLPTGPSQVTSINLFSRLPECKYHQ